LKKIYVNKPGKNVIGRPILKLNIMSQTYSTSNFKIIASGMNRADLAA